MTQFSTTASEEEDASMNANYPPTPTPPPNQNLPGISVPDLQTLVNQIQELQRQNLYLQSQIGLNANHIHQPKLPQLKVKEPPSWSGKTDKLPFKTWRFSIEQYLKVCNAEESTLGAYQVSSRLTDSAAIWYQHRILKDKIVYQTPAKLLDDLATYANLQVAESRLRDELASLQQSSSIEHYIDRFKELMNLIPDLGNIEAMDKFKRGLSRFWKTELVRSRCTSLEDSMQYLQELEDQIGTKKMPSKSTARIANNNHMGDLIDTSTPMDIDAFETSTKRGPPWKKLTDNERAYLYNNNGCTKCRKINTNHTWKTCPLNQNSISTPAINEIELHLDEIETRLVETTTNTSIAPIPKSTSSNSSSSLINDINDNPIKASISLSAAAEQVFPLSSNIKFLFPSTVDNIPCSTLVDSGCTAMVMQRRFAIRHQFPIHKGTAVTFKFGNGTSSYSTEFTFVTLKIGNYKRDMQFYLVDSKELLILGVPFFENIIATINWKYKIFNFREHGSAMEYQIGAIGKSIIKRPKYQHVKVVSYQSIEQIQRNVKIFGSIQLDQVDNVVDFDAIENGYSPILNEPPPPPMANSTKLTKIWNELTTKYSKLFSEPTNLPPDRPETHKIKLFPDSKLPSWRPI
ncbi:hypothetical protein BC833DRAFT_626322, partial [Globomyces pollinis-pini]